MKTVLWNNAQISNIKVWEYIGNLAEWAMLQEVYTTPKPGLVDRYSNGAHTDMTVATFEKSAHVLREFFEKMAYMGFEYYKKPETCFAEIKKIGQDAEIAMKEATNGVNTHKGLIFLLGILCAASSGVFREKGYLTIRALIVKEQQMVKKTLLGEMEMITSCCDDKKPVSHGEKVIKYFGIAGARGEALSGYSSVVKNALPVMKHGVTHGYDYNLVKIQTLFSLMQCVNDTNIISRTSPEKMAYVQNISHRFLSLGGAYQKDSIQILKRLDCHFTKENLSAGGCADLLAVTIFLYRLSIEQIIPFEGTEKEI